MSLLKKLLMLVFFFSVVFFIFLFLYLTIFFIPYQEKIHKIYDSIPEKRKNFVISHQRIFLCLGNDMKSFVSRTLIKKFLLKDKTRKIEWHIHSFLWFILLEYFYEPREIISLYIYYSKYNIENYLNTYFKKTLIELTKDEIITLILILRNPMYTFHKNSENLHSKVLELKRKLNTCKYS